MPLSTSSRVVLIVDDRADTRELYAIILSGAGFECRTAADHDEARAYLTDMKADVVILDLLLPRLEDGLSLASYIRRCANPPPVIAVTGAPPERFPSGVFCALMLKPIEPEALIHTVRACLSRPTGPTS